MAGFNWPTPTANECRAGVQIRRGGAKGSERSLSTYVAYIERDSTEYEQDPEYREIRRKYMSSKSIYPTPVCMDTLPPKSEEALRRESLLRPHRSRPSNLRDMVSQQNRWEELDREKYGMNELFETEADRKQSQQQTSEDNKGRIAEHSFLTPGTTGFSNGSGNCEKANRLAEEGVLSEEERVSFRAGNGGQLSPDWTEWLMGWPIGWTDLKPMNREDFERWRLAALDGTWWAFDPADLPKDHPGYLSRLTEDSELRANRLKAIGNRQVPLCVFVFETLAREFIHDRETAETDGQE